MHIAMVGELGYEVIIQKVYVHLLNSDTFILHM